MGHEPKTERKAPVKQKKTASSARAQEPARPASKKASPETPAELAAKTLARMTAVRRAATRATTAREKPALEASFATADAAPVAPAVAPPAGNPAAGRALAVAQPGMGEPTTSHSPLDQLSPGRSFSPPLGELDIYLSGEGNHQRLYEKMGAHLVELDGVKGVTFAVWAPNARGVSVVGEFNNWDGRTHPMRCLGDSGIWSTFIPNLAGGCLYKYEIRTQDGLLRIKADPYAFACELRPGTASRIWDVSSYAWNDQGWMEYRRTRNWRHEPMSVYEVHLGSWMRGVEEDHRWLNYRELAPRLVDHLRRYKFTHVELLPIAEHLLDQSWGYQVTGYYAPTSRHGTPDDFKFLVDSLHQAGIGIIIDWVPGHFPRDDSGLRWFDGTALYEHADPRQGEQPDWGTMMFNYGRNEVRNFLMANALFWLDVYHIDGLRVDAVASMLYLDYSKQPGEWIPNRYGGKENLDAIDFLRRTNELIYGLYPGTFTVAEESTDWGGVTLPTYLGGLGFGFKWDMGWMHDTLVYFSKDPVHRCYHQNDLTFGMLYAYSETFINPLSHDEVVHGKGSLLYKMPGDEWQRFANLRCLYAYMYTRPGKKLLFMGAEFAQSSEWCSDQSLDWHLAQYPVHAGVERMLEDLGKLYHRYDALWAWDPEPRGFQWIDCSDSQSCVVAYIRRGPNGFLVVALNLTPVPRVGYRIGVPDRGYYQELLNTDSAIYGGSNLGNGGGLMTEEVRSHGQQWSLNLILPPLAAVVFELAR